MDVEVSLFDDATGPQPSHQLVLADDLALSLGQSTQDTKRAPVNPHRLTIVPQFGAAKIEPKTAEPDFPVLHRMRSTRIFRSLNKDLKAAWPVPSSAIAPTVAAIAAKRQGEDVRMSVSGELVGEILRYGALCFVAPIIWESSKHRRNAGAKTWPWALLFAVLALGQLAIAVLHPQEITQAFTTT